MVALVRMSLRFGNLLKPTIGFYTTALKGCRGIVFTHDVWMGRRVLGRSFSGLYLRVTLTYKILSGLYLGNYKMYEFDTW